MCVGAAPAPVPHCRRQWQGQGEWRWGLSGAYGPGLPAIARDLQFGCAGGWWVIGSAGVEPGQFCTVQVRQRVHGACAQEAGADYEDRDGHLLAAGRDYSDLE